MLIHQAQYGERDGAHALLRASAANDPVIAALQPYTDRAFNVSLYIPWEPYLTGFPFRDRYVLAKTFPDPSASRSGMVFTHALIFDLIDAGNLADLGCLLPLFPESPQHSGSLQAIEIDKPVGDTHTVPDRVQGLESLVQTLVSNSSKSAPAVWLGQEGFDAVIVGVWNCLWPAIRRELRFRLSFGPQDTTQQGFTIVSTPAALESRWRTFPIVRVGDRAPSPTLATAFVLRQPDAAYLHALAADLDAPLASFSDVRLLMYAAGYLERLEHVTAEEARALGLLLVKLSPDPTKGLVLKRKVFQELLRRTRAAGAADIAGLRAIDPALFPDGHQLLTQTLEEWIASQVSSTTDNDAEQTAPLLVEAYNTDDSFWAEALRQAIRNALVVWRPMTARVLWLWWQARPELIDLMQHALPEAFPVERDFATTCPRTLASAVGDAVRLMAARLRWLMLHAVTVASYQTPRRAVEVQMLIDTEPRHIEALRALAARIGDDALIDVALHVGEERLITLAGHSCAQRPELLGKLDVTNSTWRKIWLQKIEARADVDVWGGISQPAMTMNRLLGVDTGGSVQDRHLLLYIARTPFGDLTEQPQRRELWKRLGPTAAEFLTTTAEGWLERLRRNPTWNDHLEPELERIVTESSRLTRHLRLATSADATFVLTIFGRFSHLGQRELLDWLRSIASQPAPLAWEDARHIGLLVRKNAWAEAARQIMSSVNSRRQDFVPALQECTSLLSLLDRFKLSFSGIDVGSRTQDEWWRAFIDLASHLYPRGPEERHVWSRAGGDLAMLRRDTPGRTQWEEAIFLLQKRIGGDISVSSLFDTMQDDFRNNEELQMLRRAGERL